MGDSPAGEEQLAEVDGWLTLRAACEQLGVSASTLRRWAEAGQLVTRRTAGGHRRFDPATVSRLVQRRAPSTQPPLTPAATMPTIGGEGPGAHPWQARLGTGPLADEMRGLGQRLLGLLIQYLVWQGDDSRFLAESRAVGRRYGLAARAAGISLPETVEAFLYFRRSVWRMALQLPAVTQATDAPELVRIAERIDHFMDGILLSAIASHGEPATTAGETTTSDEMAAGGLATRRAMHVGCGGSV